MSGFNSGGIRQRRSGQAEEGKGEEKAGRPGMRSNKGEGFPHTENHLAAEFPVHYYTSGRRDSIMEAIVDGLLL